MTEPKRVLSDPSASDFQRTLLGSWELERPTKGAREKALAALGVAAIGTTAAGTTLTGTGAASAAGTATGASMAPKAVAAVAWVKWASIAALMIGGGVAAVVWTAHRAPANPLPQAPSASMAAPLPPRPRPRPCRKVRRRS
ncbi:hypothetical protein AKJ09_07413 [Labilithrix luteola]|uniref:Uncharacterized protein n=1 Tax=Labilithrix luteola TaxID=1391654 RepID=A0A0K1Q5T6_9BACT|nr:hypothetical protein [Labilithrix luteola]AKV00750.1 hypothetical protein AKJ09_07413 [Labilithrix luteola]